MLRIKEYVRATSLEEAWQLNQKRSNRIIGGMLWMRLSNKQIQKAIDLSDLGLDKIEETDDEFSIGCMVRLRELELHEGLNAICDGLINKSVRDIVGTQFRNLATIGGSLYGRFGFSDVLTAFLVLDAYVEMYKGGIIPISEFVNQKKDNKDILVRVIVKKPKTKESYVYLSHRNTKTDFPVLAVAMAKAEDGYKISVGARPSKAKLYQVATKEEAMNLDIPTDSNMRASGEYRKHLAKVLIKRGFKEIENDC
ncbi:Xanthine dehydrogenase, FAD binding subunit [Lachnospiraceae bacterium TWA4]|nr:Xanthine dehydrogenase, FAD binding subunit [Lachnospiraceae bacterium TWA4]